MNLEEIQKRKQELRKLRETTNEQKKKEFESEWKDIVSILKKTKTDFAQAMLDNFNVGIAPQGKALEICKKLLEDSLKPKPKPRAKKPATKTTRKTKRSS